MPISWHPPDELHAAARRALLPGGVVLDIGCGIQPQTLVPAELHVACEPFPEYAARLRDRVGPGFVVLQLGWDDALRAFPPRSVDTVALLDVVEHLDKEDGRRLLRQTEGLARRQIVVFTPLGFLPQEATAGPDAWGLGGGSTVQVHRSGWSPEDFDPSWDILAAEAFHTRDHQGRPLPRPFGAFFAIRRLEGAPPEARDRRQALLRDLSARAASIGDERVLEALAQLVGRAARIHRPWMLAPARAALAAVLGLRDARPVRAAYAWVAARRRVRASRPRGT